MKLLANRLDWQTTPIKSLFMAAFPLRGYAAPLPQHPQGVLRWEGWGAPPLRGDPFRSQGDERVSFPDLLSPILCLLSSSYCFRLT